MHKHLYVSTLKNACMLLQMNVYNVCVCAHEEIRQGHRFVREGDLSELTEMNLVLSLWLALGIFLSISRSQVTLCHSPAHPTILNFPKLDGVNSIMSATTNQSVMKIIVNKLIIE